MSKNKSTKQSKDEPKKGKSDDKSPKKKNKNEKRKDKYAGVEKGDLPNKATAFAKLVLNVKSCQKWMNEYYERYTIEKKKKEKKEDKEDKKKTSKKDESDDEEEHEQKDNRVRILNAHFALTAADQVVCLTLVNLALERAKKKDAGLHTISEENMMDIVKLDKDFSFAFGRYLSTYSTNDNYYVQMGFAKNEVNQFIESYASGGGITNIKVEPQALNFLMYIMLKNRIQLVESAFQMAVYAGKSSVTDKAILLSIKTVHVGGLQKAIYKKVEDVSTIVRGLGKESSDNDSKDGSKKGSKDKKSSKKGSNDAEKKKDKKKSKKDESDDEKESDEEKSDNESNESEDGSDEESGEESE